MRRLLPCLACAALALTRPAPAAALEPGTLIVGVQAVSGTADFVSPPAPHLSAYDHGELGLQGSLWYLLDESWALAVSGGASRTREANHAPGAVSRYYQQRAWNARAGLDRMVPVARDVILYLGPGVEYWTGHANFIGYYPGQPRVEAPEVTRYSGSGRCGALLVITDSFSLTGQIGYRMGYATATAGGAETGWYTNGYEAAAGIAFAF